MNTLVTSLILSMPKINHKLIYSSCFFIVYLFVFFFSTEHLICSPWHKINSLNSNMVEYSGYSTVIRLEHIYGSHVRHAGECSKKQSNRNWIGMKWHNKNRQNYDKIVWKRKWRQKTTEYSISTNIYSIPLYSVVPVDAGQRRTCSTLFFFRCVNLAQCAFAYL